MDPSETPPITRIVQLVAARYGLMPAELLGKQRTAGYVEARHICFWVCEQTQYDHRLTIAEFARELGRDRTTVIAGVKACARRRAKDLRVKASSDEIVERFRAERRRVA